MYSQRFERRVHVTRHAAQRTAERDVSDELLLKIIDAVPIRQYACTAASKRSQSPPSSVRNRARSLSSRRMAYRRSPRLV